MYNRPNKTVTKVSDTTTYQGFRSSNISIDVKKRVGDDPTTLGNRKRKKTTQQFSILGGSHPHVHYSPPNSKHVLVANNYHIINKTSTVQ